MLLSYSKLRLFFDCPLKFQKVALQGLKEMFGEEQLSAMNAGTTFHELVKEFYQSPFPPADFTESRAWAVAESLSALEPIDSELNFEAYFTHEINGVTFQGYADAVGKDAIYEIKSYDKVGDVEYRQAALYVKAFNKQKAVLLTPNQVITLTPEEIEFHYAELEEAVKQILAGVFEPKTGKHCETCPILSECPLMNSIDSIQSHDEVQLVSIDKLAEIYERMLPVMKAIEKQLKNAAAAHKEIQLQNGKILREVVTEYKVLRDDVTVQDVFQVFGIDFLSIDTKKLQEISPELFEVRYRRSWQIYNPGEVVKDGSELDS